MSETTTHEAEMMTSGELVYRATDPAAMRYRDAADGEGGTLEGRMMPYGEWTEVNSAIEGHFMERFAPGALAKTMREQMAKVRVLFEHGADVVLGRQAIAVADDLRDEEDGAYFSATLLRGIPELLVSGLRSGQYGSSIRFKPVKWDRVRSPGEAEHNPEGLPEHTIREAFLREFSVVTFPQYAGATAGVRSLTDEVAARQLMRDPVKLAEMIMARTEPQHSVREDPEPEGPEDPEPEAPADGPERSRSTQPPDYLRDTEEDEWLL